MATFLTREDIVSHLGKIIEEADRELVLISPYIKADDECRTSAKMGHARGVERPERFEAGSAPWMR